MAKFTVRIELYGAAEASALYKLLDKKMAGRGFQTVIESTEGRRFELPTGEYSYEGEESGEEVREAAKEVAAEVGRTSAVLVTQSQVRWWSGLRTLD